MNECRACGNVDNNARHVFKEKYFGLGDEFEYLECGKCKSLSIMDIPHNMERYYPKDYYSYARKPYNRISGWLKGRRDRYYLDRSSIIGYILSRVSPAPSYIEWLKNLDMPYGSTILDVGSGMGKLIVNLQDAGFPSLGIDAYIADKILYSNGARVLKQSLVVTTGSFDCIMLHHSLEHMADPSEVFGCIRRLLRPGGKLLIRTPIAGTHAWKRYGSNWFQLDAPRHFVIFTEAALCNLAERMGFSTKKIIYDSQANLFWASEQYVKGIALASPHSYALHPENPIFSPEHIAEYEQQAALLNAKNDGDQAAFYLIRNT